MFFRRRCFRSLGRALGALGAQKGSQKEPQGRQKRAWRHLGEHAKSMAGTVREAYGEVPGRVQEPPFSRLRPHTLSAGVPRSIFSDFVRFGAPFRDPGAPFWAQNADFFQDLIFSHFLDHFWEGPAAGAGLLGP